MAYPKMKGKHASKAVFSVDEYIEYKKKVGAVPKSKVPESIILCYSMRLAESIENLHKISEIRGVLGNIGKLYSIGSINGKVGLLASFGIGAPATVLHMEELSGWGAKRFVIIGMAGAITDKLRIGDVVVCTKSVRDEGTSHHYVKHSKYAFPSKKLSDLLYLSLNSKLSSVHKGPSWTIDAPYRETVDEMKRYRSEGVLTVEMEASALFAVGQLREIETAAVFVVSDILSEEKWKPKFRSKIVLQNLLKTFATVKDVLQNLPANDLSKTT
jgi:uridine phosphorylase